QVADLLHGKEEQVWADSGYRGAQARVKRDVLWNIAGRPSDIAKMPEGRAKARARKNEYEKASVRAKVEHPFRVIKRQFGLAKVRFTALDKLARSEKRPLAVDSLAEARAHPPSLGNN
ncbi:Transposase DDE domain, partial [Variovorax sp. OK605]|uniref:transposase n=1 Tax=Variovorax sp. OK605 TaxID=1855317 RepID=UPI0008EBFDCF